MCLLLLSQDWMLVDGSFIACISLLVLQDQNDSLQRRANSQFAGKQASRPTSDREELIAKRENLLFRTIGQNFPIHRQKWQIPLTDGATTPEHITCRERTNNIHS